jgi:hypothetical protein
MASYPLTHLPIYDRKVFRKLDDQNKAYLIIALTKISWNTLREFSFNL